MVGMESDKNQKMFSMLHKTQAAPDKARLALRTTKDWGEAEAENVERKWNHHVRTLLRSLGVQKESLGWQLGSIAMLRTGLLNIYSELKHKHFYYKLSKRVVLCETGFEF